jgi:hypothetical protein
MERCCGQAAMVHADHVNLWWGVELLILIPLLKHTNEFYFCVKIPCMTDANTWEVGQVNFYILGEVWISKKHHNHR